ncbi:YjfI family protein [Agaribacterium sp. ZY112]|uniref:YjfI family protein n=1 Tax=Agaribacterium sp. ZY112 TaxID=3233574 RepID=UPI003526AABC
MHKQLQELTLKLADANFQGYSFNCLLIPGEQAVLQITVSGQEEIPIYVTVTETQILCIAYLFKENEVKPEAMTELNERCLQLNVPMPLSAYAKIDDYYALFGSLSIHSLFDNVMLEIVTLSDNSIAALEAVEDLLK